MGRVILAVLLLGVLELATYTTVMAIARAQPIIQTEVPRATQGRDCVPYWMIYQHIVCPDPPG